LALACRFSGPWHSCRSSISLASPSLSEQEGAASALRAREEAEMHLHLARVAAPPRRAPRPAKVIQLETRRQARLERARPERQPPRTAA